MARTVQALAVYYCCCTMAVLYPAVAVAVASSDQQRQQQQQQRMAVNGSHNDDSGVVAAAVRNKRWSTTFGANSNNKNATANNAFRDCTTDSDCLDTPYTSCAIDPSDRKRRCLCADGKQPFNGDCMKKPRALRTPCELDVECLPNAVCKNNATSSNPRLKTCMCKDGFTEENDTCNYADLLTFNLATLLITVFTTWICNEHRA